MKHLKAKISLKKEGKKVTVIASDESLDRHGEVLPIKSWDLSKFKGSPRMLVDHDHRVEKIVGKWVNVRVENNQLLMDAEFHGITELSRAVEEMVNEGFLDTVSVGFIGNEPTEDKPEYSNELIETSWVTVPANPNARLVKALEMPVTEDEKAKLDVFAKDNEAPVEKKEDTIAEYTPEAMEKNGWKIIKSVEDFNEWQKSYEGGNALNLCETVFIEKLIADSEKLKTLTESEGDEVEVSKALRNKKVNQIVLKEMARNLNGLLRAMNKIKS